MRRESFSLNPYEVLGVSPDTPPEEIQVAYRQHALRWHPDHNPNDEYAMRMMQRINTAWAILKDEQTRETYDRWERGGANTASGPNAWEQPQPSPPPDSEWYTPPPPLVISCARCNSTNEEDSAYCYSCGYPFDEAQSRQRSSSGNYASPYNANADSESGLPADFLERLFAHLIDFLAVSASAIALVLTLDQSDELVYRSRYVWIFLAIPVLYFTILISGGLTTIGKGIFDLEVVRTDGSKIGIPRAFARYLCYYLSFSLLFIGFLMIAFREDKRALHDLICDTKVVYR